MALISRALTFVWFGGSDEFLTNPETFGFYEHYNWTISLGFRWTWKGENK